MQKALAIVFLALFSATGIAGPAAAEDPVAPSDIILQDNDVNLDAFLWLKRPLVIFADSPADPRFILQMEYINEGLNELAERDVVVLTDTARGEKTRLRERLRPRGFTLVLIGKDGTVYLRKPMPWDVRELSRVIDKMPLRQDEMRERNGES